MQRSHNRQGIFVHDEEYHYYLDILWEWPSGIFNAQGMPAQNPSGVESTGAYHELLADLAQAQGYTVFLLNPLDTRHYAKAMGTRAKTDRVDATLIARLIAQEHTRLRAYTPPTPNQRKLDRLIRRRATIVRLKGTLKLTMRHLGGFAAELRAVVGKLDALLAKNDATMAVIAAGSPQHQEAQHRVETIVGVGPLVGISLTNTLERVPFRKADAFVAFIGLDPRGNASGHKAGRRRLSKRGPAQLRRLLFNAAMSAIKNHRLETDLRILPHSRLEYDRLVGDHCPQNRPSRLVDSSYRTTFNPERITKCLT